MNHWRPRIGLVDRIPLLPRRHVGHLLGGGPSSGGHPQAVAPQGRAPPGAVAGADEVEDEAVAEAGARTEAEAATEKVTGAEAVPVAEAGGAGRHAADVRGPLGEQPREAAGAAYSRWCLPVYGGWQTPGLWSSSVVPVGPHWMTPQGW
jgi:hypothetical protein